MKSARDTFTPFVFIRRGRTSISKTISTLTIIFLIFAIFSLNFELCFCSCARAEYEIDGRCCPMCAPGNHVYRHCTEDTSTACVPCYHSTFIDAPNGLTDCFSCTVCDPGRGLRENTVCTRSSNTVCEPLDGYYCTHQYSGSCILAEKHTKCTPGQYIKHRGTAFKDTECAECSDGTFSNSSLQICQPHSKCENLGLTEIKPGTRSSDAECGNKTPAALIAGIIVPVLIVAVAVIIFFKIKHKTAQHPAGHDSLIPTEENLYGNLSRKPQCSRKSQFKKPPQ
ncbi:tumor necrosis factor receptor superfamily member 14-like [Colossoma macropomum]|uniref:tumor necrosis factor receptor superfamily member 14-like n=1 Tax=Colossoma macropomum TaxID=42526 RepID=UPI001864D138|nr:tumor necrosis factor receptor superfamily member 14-like [Colossoma macropomum]XP_036435337.1 tumor necrosis factor receptor superfamily member 14-like [Colossoma macropomum]XP_036435338.1 tumor necrosis factor receptor superfamily member 14-like [Colossoma macropomum]XP_036435339.1 tumor necrosis factor receptor superfamily member 14-like [Colossoma macropomum]XP_036435341.1 tumor necrosis factor receptor superfamily member 14-like [Colossoma macropomum]XP_036435342.1 tumor necrosis facto